MGLKVSTHGFVPICGGMVSSEGVSCDMWICVGHYTVYAEFASKGPEPYGVEQRVRMVSMRCECERE